MIYNLGIVLPVLLLGVAKALGMSPVKVDNFRNRHNDLGERNGLKFIR